MRENRQGLPGGGEPQPFEQAENSAPVVNRADFRPPGSRGATQGHVIGQKCGQGGGVAQFGDEVGTFRSHVESFHPSEGEAGEENAHFRGHEFEVRTPVPLAAGEGGGFEQFAIGDDFDPILAVETFETSFRPRGDAVEFAVMCPSKGNGESIGSGSFG